MDKSAEYTIHGSISYRITSPIITNIFFSFRFFQKKIITTAIASLFPFSIAYDLLNTRKNTRSTYSDEQKKASAFDLVLEQVNT